MSFEVMRCGNRMSEDSGILQDQTADWAGEEGLDAEMEELAVGRVLAAGTGQRVLEQKQISP